MALKNSAVWVMDENGIWIPGVIDIPEGWFALADPDPCGEAAQP
jgi:hypothetical protein